MEKILRQVSMIHYKEFRKKAMDRCGWTASQYANRFSGNTKLTPAEREVLQTIVDKLKEENASDKQ